jgi:alanine-synthesizing transaminase
VRPPFSSRLHWDLRPNRLAQALDAKHRAGVKILDLTQSNPTRAGLAYPSGAILGAFADTRSLVYQPKPAGLLAAREAVAGYYAARGQAVEPSRILLTTSTSESYAWLFKLLADPGDEILVPRPSYPLFEFLAQMESVHVKHYPLIYNDSWSIDTEALAAAISGRTRAIVLVNPNNPTGSFVKRCELDVLVPLCAEQGIVLIADEVFADYAFGPDAERVSSLAHIDEMLAFCLSGLSKIAGLPQMKLGWIVIGGPAAQRIQATDKLELIADTYLSVGTPVQHALPKLLAAGENVRQQIADRVHENLQHLRAAIGDHSPAQVLRVEGGWYATLRVPRTKTEEQWCLDLLEHQDVLVQPGFFYDFEAEAYLVLSLLTEAQTFREGVERIVASL